jgi:hypothetical protein
MDKLKINISVTYSESPKDNSIEISHKGKKYCEEDLNDIRLKISENYVPNNNYENDVAFKPEKDLSQEDLNELSDWRIKINASVWKSRQRSLRKKNKLDQYKIDSLNKLGMVWNPKEDIWEKKYLIYRKRGFCDEMEIWIKDQRDLFSNNKISKENLHRLEAINFPFQANQKEEFPFTYNSLYELEEKLRKKKRKLELKLINNPPKNLTQDQRVIIKNEKQNKNHKEDHKPRNSFYTKLYMVNGKTNGNIQGLNFEDAKKVIKEIEKGISIYNKPTKEYLDDVVKKKSLGHFTKSFVKTFYDDLGLDLTKREKYKEISIFNDAHVNTETRIYACIIMLNYFKFIAERKMKTFMPLDYLISYYKKEKNADELILLKKYVTQYPLLFELYNHEIEQILIKL